MSKYKKDINGFVITREQLFEILSRLEVWREERHLTTIAGHNGLLANLLEELSEYYRATNSYEKIDAICDMIVFILNSSPKDYFLEHFMKTEAYPRVNSQLDTAILNYVCQYKLRVIDRNDNKPYSKNILVVSLLVKITQLGFDPIKALDETLKEIESRVGHFDEKINKFVKDLNKSKIYKANYLNCKI